MDMKASSLPAPTVRPWIYAATGLGAMLKIKTGPVDGMDAR
jgi:hypothetical protein